MFVRAKDGRRDRRLLPLCIICNSTPPGGLRDGIYLEKAFICSICEQEILFTQRQEKRYGEIVRALKRLWSNV